MKMSRRLLRTLKTVIFKKQVINFDFLDSKYLNHIAINPITNPTIANIFFKKNYPTFLIVVQEFSSFSNCKKINLSVLIVTY
jgi:hypothetical protein